MRHRFVQVKNLAGELKRTEIRRGIRYQLTTKEFVLSREEQAYHLLLQHIIGIIQKDETDRPTVHSFADYGTVDQLYPVYKIVTTQLSVYSPSGEHEKGASTLYASLSPSFVESLMDVLHSS